ncbi:hypothetical protein ACN47E_006912 [Coniothyrium glycines]
MVENAELLSALGAPARAAARALLMPRYALDAFGPVRRWRRNAYARQRFGSSYLWRVWLMYDARDLEVMENLINEGSDDQLLKLREDKLETFWFVALVGALLASVALQALNLPLITGTSFVVRGAFTLSSMLSVLSTFFTCLQQRELIVVRSAPALRAWLSNGIRYTNANGELVFQSSLASLTLLEAPYEYLSIAIVNFVVGVAAYLGSAFFSGIRLHSEKGLLPELAVLIYFAVGTGFAFSMFPLLLGTKDRENRITRQTLDDLDKAEITIKCQRMTPKSADAAWVEDALPTSNEQHRKRSM